MTIRHLHPADELALIRNDIKRLERREAELRDGFLGGRLPLTGTDARVEVHAHTRRVFLKDKLPAPLLSDPALWEERSVLAVVVVTPSERRYRPPSDIGDRSAPDGRHPVPG